MTLRTSRPFTTVRHTGSSIVASAATDGALTTGPAMSNTVEAAAGTRAPDGAPRLLLFRTVRGSISGFLLGHLREQVAALSQWFDVVVIEGPCDYGQVCDELEPDLCVFETGVYSAPRRIINTGSHPSIPKLGFLHADAFDSSRSAFIAVMAEWGVETFFTTSMAMAEYTPEIADRLFVWPNAVDPTIFRDHRQPKSVEILIAGSRAAHYPWRTAINRAVNGAFETASLPHFGWNGEAGTEAMVAGAAYARALNSAVFVPTCGTMARDVVRKHLEIPASGTCLVTEDTPSIRAMGFSDMENCVFAEADTVVDRLRSLLADPESLSAITQAGHDLVHSRHTFAHRDQVRQWYDLAVAGRAGASLRQVWPSGRIEPSAPRSVEPAPLVGRDRILLREAWVAIGEGDIAGADRLVRACLDYWFTAEAAAAMVWIRLLAGEAAAGLEWASRALIPPLGHSGAPEPDPVQWALLIRALLCRGDVWGAQAAADRFPGVMNRELHRMRGAVAALTDSPRPTPASAPRPTVCPLPAVSDREWTDTLGAMLEACGQRALAAALLSGTMQATGGRRAVYRAAAGRRRIDVLVRRIRAGSTKSPLERRARRVLSPIKRRHVRAQTPPPAPASTRMSAPQTTRRAVR